MKIDLYTKAALTVIAFLLAVVALGPLVRPLPIQAQAGPDHSYLHFDPQVTKITLPDGSADVFGRVAIDLRNGNVYGFPTELLGYPRRPIDRKPASSDPIYLGRFNIDKIEAGTGWRRPRVPPRPEP